MKIYQLVVAKIDLSLDIEGKAREDILHLDTYGNYAHNSFTKKQKREIKLLSKELNEFVERHL